MKDCFELLSIFTSFLNEIKNQFGQVIKILRSDNAKEYFSSALSKVEFPWYPAPVYLSSYATTKWYSRKKKSTLS